MFGWFRSKSAAPTLDALDDVLKLIHTQGVEKAGVAIRKAADDGSLVCQILMSQMGLVLPPHKRTGQILRETEHYTRLAAQNGDPDSQFNLAKMHIDKVEIIDGSISAEGVEHIKQAKFWHRKAAAQGFQASIENLKELEEFPD